MNLKDPDQKKRNRALTFPPRDAASITIVSVQSTLIRGLLEAISEVSQHCPEGTRFPCFSKALFHDLTFSSREKTEWVSGKRTPTGLGNPEEHHLPPPPSWPPNSQPSESCPGMISKRPCLQLCVRALRCHFSAAYKEQC